MSEMVEPSGPPAGEDHVTLMTAATRTEVQPTKTELLDALYRREAPGALRLAYLLTGDRSRAEGLVQDAFLRLYERWRAVVDIEPELFGAYFRKAVVNAARNAHRHRLVVDAYVEREGARMATTLEPDDFATRDAVWTSIQQLPTRQREVIVCRFYLDLSERDTADALGCSPGTVKSSLSRGLAALRAVLQTEEELS